MRWSRCRSRRTWCPRRIARKAGCTTRRGQEPSPQLVSLLRPGQGHIARAISARLRPVGARHASPLLGKRAARPGAGLDLGVTLTGAALPLSFGPDLRHLVQGRRDPLRIGVALRLHPRLARSKLGARRAITMRRGGSQTRPYVVCGRSIAEEAQVPGRTEGFSSSRDHRRGFVAMYSRIRARSSSLRIT